MMNNPTPEFMDKVVRQDIQIQKYGADNNSYRVYKMSSGNMS
jgi:hypothetical protein